MVEAYPGTVFIVLMSMGKYMYEISLPRFLAAFSGPRSRISDKTTLDVFV
jgi:hypothetical protein